MTDSLLFDRASLEAVPFGQPVRILDEVYLVRVPLPGSALAALNSYFILDGDSTLIVDVGFNHPDCERALDQALTALGRGWDGVRVVLTHSHPDHTGNLERIYHHDLPVYANMHSFKEVEARMQLQTGVFMPFLQQVLTPDQAELLASYPLRASAAMLPLRCDPRITYVGEGDVIAAGRLRFRVIETPGHDDWHLCLHEPTERLLISGDHVLTRITPAVVTWATMHDALAQFLASLRKVRDVDADLVLPAHGPATRDLSGRVDELLDHHDRRLAEILGLVASGHDDLVSISSHARWKHDDWEAWDLDQKLSSMGETMAHLVHLIRQGAVKQTVCKDDYRFELP